MNIRNGICFALLFSSLAGCSVMNWKSEYSCPGMPNGVVCKSPIEVYEMTEHVDRLTQDTKAGAEGDVPKGVKAATVSALARIPGQVSTGRSVPKDAQPVLEPARVMRVWIAPWIDAKQDLHMPGYVFTEITPRRWSFGEATAIRGKPLVPIQSDLSGGEGENGVEVGGEAKLLTPKGLIQGMQQSSPQGRGRPQVGGGGSPMSMFGNQQGTGTAGGNTGGSDFFGR